MEKVKFKYDFCEQPQGDRGQTQVIDWKASFKDWTTGFQEGRFSALAKMSSSNDKMQFVVCADEVTKSLVLITGSPSGEHDKNAADAGFSKDQILGGGYIFYAALPEGKKHFSLSAWAPSGFVPTSFLEQMFGDTLKEKIGEITPEGKSAIINFNTHPDPNDKDDARHFNEFVCKCKQYAPLRPTGVKGDVKVEAKL